MRDSSRGSNVAAQTTKNTGREKPGCGSWGSPGRLPVGRARQGNRTSRGNMSSHFREWSN